MRQPWNMRSEKAQTVFANGNVRVFVSGLQPLLTEMLGEALRKPYQKPTESNRQNLFHVARYVCTSPSNYCIMIMLLPQW